MRLNVSFYRRDFAQPVATCFVSEPQSLTWSAFGGPKQAVIKLQGALPDMLKAFNLLRSPLMICDRHASPVWWGYVSSICIINQKASFTTSLDEVFNQVRVIYSYISPDNKLADRYMTTTADNTRSQADYGIREMILKRSDIDEDFAEQLRDTFLANHGWPKTVLSRYHDNDGCYAILSCSGWFSTLGWQHYESDNGFYANHGPGPGSFVFADASTHLYPSQSFITTGAASLKYVYFMLMKYGSPTQNISIILQSDNGASPGAPSAPLATSDPLPAASIDNDSHVWVKFTFSTPYALSASTKYWLTIDQNGVSAANYLSIRLDENRNYPNNRGLYYNGSSWVRFPPTVSHWGSPDTFFRAVCVQDTGTQLLDIASAGNQFFEGIQGFQTGIASSPYRYSDQTCLREIKDLMLLGTAGNRLILAKVTPERVLKFYEQPDPEVPRVLMEQNGCFIKSTGQILKPYMPPIGEWAAFSGTNWVTTPWDNHRLPLCFVEHVKFDCLTGKVRVNDR